MTFEEQTELLELLRKDSHCDRVQELEAKAQAYEADSVLAELQLMVR